MIAALSNLCTRCGVRFCSNSVQALTGLNRTACCSVTRRLPRADRGARRRGGLLTGRILDGRVSIHKLELKGNGRCRRHFAAARFAVKGTGIIRVGYSQVTHKRGFVLCARRRRSRSGRPRTARVGRGPTPGRVIGSWPKILQVGILPVSKCSNPAPTTSATG